MDIEEVILKEVGPAIREAVHEKLKGYSSPLDKVVHAVVAKHSEEIQRRLDEAIKTAIAATDFDAAVRANLTHKLARVLSSKLEGAVEKVANDIRSNPAFRARLTLAVEQILKDLGDTVGVAQR